MSSLTPSTPARGPPAPSPSLPEGTNGALSTEQGHASLSAMPSHDSSSLSGSERGGGVERVNPFEQQIISANSTSSSGGARPAPPLEQMPSHQSTSPDRVAAAGPQAPSSPQPTMTGVLPPSPSPSSMPRPPLDISSGHPHHPPPQQPHHLPQMPTAEEDEYTHSSSAVNSTEPASSYTPSTSGSHPPPQAVLQPPPGISQTFARFFDSTRKRMSANSRNTSDEDLIEDLDGMIINGYLQKLGRNGKWQTRWFESDGECLSYYKNENRTKLLATLDLEKVGAIMLDPSDDEECAFTIQVLGRLYHLRAENKVSCTDWVITLNRIKEAKMHQGNVKLVSGYHQQQHQQNSSSPVDLLDHNENLVAPRVVVVSNRQRTRAVAETQDFDHIMREDVNMQNQLEMIPGGGSSKRLSTIGTVVLARWNKRRSSLSRLRSKLAKWARSLRNLSCMSDGDVALDNHVHPPGHDDDRKKKHLGWIGKETTSAAPDAAVAQNVDPAEKRAPRKMSSASEDIRVLS